MACPFPLSRWNESRRSTVVNQSDVIFLAFLPIRFGVYVVPVALQLFLERGLPFRVRIFVDRPAESALGEATRMIRGADMRPVLRS